MTRAFSILMKHSKAKHVAGRDINIHLTLQLRAEELRCLLEVLSKHLGAPRCIPRDVPRRG